MFSFQRFVDKRRFQRHTCTLPANISLGRQQMQGRVVNLSRGGFLFRAQDSGFLQDRSGVVTLGEASHRCMLLRRGPTGLHFLFNANLTQRELESLFTPRREATPEPVDDPYAVLGVPRSAGAEQIKRAWRVKVKQVHPDLLGANADPRRVAHHNARLAQLNTAYRMLRQG